VLNASERHGVSRRATRWRSLVVGASRRYRAGGGRRDVPLPAVAVRPAAARGARAAVRAPFVDHITVKVRDLAASRAFYEAALAPFGVRVVPYDEGEIGIGPEGSEDLGLSEGEPRAPVHVAFLAHDPATVDAFHAAALANGGSDEGAPGLRPHYHPNYYGAYVRDPDGNKLQAVCHSSKG
jgi:catechol 2,3-dioxygenase-like lactoylglutathione lyase family enzyme